ncbi:MAG: hypothetical protein KDK76_05710 [Chlamydiia bacterium]|nr:hypothetical protein [Chlamydiia bacterium]
MKFPFTFGLKIALSNLFENIYFVGGFYFCCLVPTFILLFSISQKKERFKEIKEEVSCLDVRMERVKELHKDQYAFFKAYGKNDHFFLDHEIESMELLKPEIEALRLVMNSPPFESCDNIKKRLEFLTKGGNRFVFSEGSRRVKNRIEEVELFQKRPVEINAHDLRKILTVVEGVKIGEEKPPLGRPQLIVRRFHLNKKKLAERETYLLEMQLIKRGVIE